ncbi:M48 family metallopeptidase [Falsiroseomonas sp.]|uniref:M48 family metallopeptidase n=1 Tax=Falsiroseomonas sp. TaxID=2870721 RepID=UPI003F72F73B
MQGRRWVCQGVLAGLAAGLCGCAGALRPSPRPEAEALEQARAEVARATATPRRILAPGEVSATLDRIARRLNPPALAICEEIGRNRCDWFIRASRATSLNAAAGLDGRVVIQRGVLDYAANDDQVALVMAHELAHHAADHVAQGATNHAVGAGIASAVMAVAVVVGAAAGSRASPTTNRRSIEGAGDSGGRLGQLLFSRGQESEADRLGALILYRAGYDLDAARGMLLTMARLSRRRETGLFDSHPAGPDRLAAYDATVAELRASRGRLAVRPEG